MDLALNNLQRLRCHKPQINKQTIHTVLNAGDSSSYFFSCHIEYMSIIFEFNAMYIGINFFIL